MHTFLKKEQSNQEIQFPRDYMENMVKNAGNWGSDFAKPATARVCVAGSTGLEPAASGVTGRRSNQTELRPPESGEMVGDTRIELVTYGL